MEREIVYISSPYSHPDRVVVFKRFVEALRVCHWAWQNGYFAYSPIAYTHPISVFVPNVRYEDWIKFDVELLRLCNRMWVLMLDGWETSKGVQGEIEIAKEFGLPIDYIDPKSIPDTVLPKDWLDYCSKVEEWIDE